jgi:PAS domain S-box-containing protein/diguanylate cyclase (GGDEF)-like protein
LGGGSSVQGAARRKAELSVPLDPEVYRSVLESLPAAVYLVDRERRILLWNESAHHLTGFQSYEVIGRQCQDNILVHCDDRDNILCGSECPLAATIRDGRPREANLYLRHKDGQRIPVRVHATPVRDAEGHIIGAAETFEERVAAAGHPAAPLLHYSLDQATGLADAESMRRHLGEMLKRFSEDRYPFGVLAIAPDRLEELKAGRGASIADRLVRVVGKTVHKSLRPADLTGRWSADTFLVVLAHCPASALTSVAERLRHVAGAASVPWWGDWVSVTLSIGGAGVRQGDTVESLVDRALGALRECMAGGGEGVGIV